MFSMPANLAATFGDEDFEGDSFRQDKRNDDIVVFQGLIFDKHGDITKPRAVHASDAETTIDKEKKLLDFLAILQAQGCLREANPDGIVIYADDQFMNRWSLKQQFKDFGLEKNLMILSNGQEVLETIDKVLSDFEK